MKRFLLILSQVFILVGACVSQSGDVRVQSIHKVVLDGYNHQDFKSMKRPFIALGRIVLSKRKLEKEFKPLFLKHGEAKIDTIVFDSRYEGTAQLSFKSVSSGRRYLKFLFNDRGKIEGMGFDYPPLAYTKSIRFEQIPNPEQAIDSIVYMRSVDQTPFNGSILVMKEGSTVYRKHFGYADLVNRTELNDSTLFELASCSKQFTAYALLILERQGKLTVFDSVRKFLPELPYPGITIEHVLSHTSGLPDYEKLLAENWDKTKFATNQDVLDLLSKEKPKVYFEPGENFLYSNTGYVLLSLIIERVSGLSYKVFLQQEIFGRLGMNHSCVYNTRRVNGEMLSNYAFGFVKNQTTSEFVLPDSLPEYKMVIYQDGITGDGTVNSCIQDMKIWQAEIIHPSLITQDQHERMCSSKKLNSGDRIHYGYGVFVREGNSTEHLIYHTGGWPGYFTILMQFDKIPLTILVLSNNSFENFTFIADDIAHLMLDGKN